MKNSGIVLVTVMWMLLILSLLSVGFAYRTRLSLAVVDYQKDETKALYLAKAVVGKVTAILEADKNEYDCLNEQWKTDPYFFDKNWFNPGEFQNVEVEYSVTDEESKINLNTDKQGLILGGLLQAAEEPVAVPLLDCILDWKDADGISRLDGAEEDYYMRLSPPYPCKNGPFDITEELLAIKGVSDVLFYGDKDEEKAGLKDVFTVYSEGKINVNTAPLEVLRTIPGINRDIGQNIVRYRSGPDGKEGTDDDRPFTTMEDVKNVPDVKEYVYQQIKTFGVLKSNYFTVEVKVTEGNLRKEVNAVVDRSSEPAKIVLWREI